MMDVKTMRKHSSTVMMMVLRELRKREGVLIVIWDKPKRKKKKSKEKIKTENREAEVKKSTKDPKDKRKKQKGSKSNEVIYEVSLTHESLQKELKRANMELASQATDIEELKHKLRKRDEEISAMQLFIHLKERELEISIAAKRLDQILFEGLRVEFGSGLEALNNGDVPTVTSFWQSVEETEYQSVYDSGIETYLAAFDQSKASKEGALREEHEEAVQKHRALAIFNANVFETRLSDYEASSKGPGKWQKFSVFLQQSLEGPIDDLTKSQFSLVEGFMRKKVSTRKTQRMNKEDRTKIALIKRLEELKHLKSVKKREFLFIDEENVHKLAVMSGVFDALVILICNSSLTSIFHMISAKPKTTLRFMELGLVNSTMEMFVDSENIISEKALLVLDTTCESNEGRTIVSGNKLVMLILLKISEFTKKNLISVMWKICKTGDGTEVEEALLLGVLKKFVVMLQVGCGEVTKECDEDDEKPDFNKKAELLGHPEDWDVFQGGDGLTPTRKEDPQTTPAAGPRALDPPQPAGTATIRSDAAWKIQRAKAGPAKSSESSEILLSLLNDVHGNRLVFNQMVIIFYLDMYFVCFSDLSLIYMFFRSGSDFGRPMESLLGSLLKYNALEDSRKSSRRLHFSSRRLQRSLEVFQTTSKKSGSLPDDFKEIF
ncbi:hypothetical protein DY000_02036227 [Brassica cretica]|uniref:U-box domain-containing protein n=1 Tax=Brassica cretica TaxID=69181 RepID=A0ABQ7BN80_BRACR|nr:hypothetical protein DY000_02036227 [Brassica cretica]